MIKISELRIGNLVKLNRLDSEVVSISTKDYIGWNEGGIENIIVKWNGVYYTCEEAELEPIPITKEMLLKCGFGRRKDQYYLIIDRGVAHSLYIEFELVDKEIFGSFWIGRAGETKMFLDIEYLHQLQNFIYAITCEKLEVEL